VNDARATPALLSLANTPGRYTGAFALKGLAAQKAAAARPLFRQIVEQRNRPPAVIVQAVRGLVAVNETAVAEAMLAIHDDANADPELAEGEVDYVIGKVLAWDKLSKAAK
jgi:hypothetical protein